MSTHSHPHLIPRRPDIAKLMRSLGHVQDNRNHSSRSKAIANDDIREFKCQWVRRLEEHNIPEAELSVKYIVDHVWQTTSGKNIAVS